MAYGKRQRRNLFGKKTNRHGSKLVSSLTSVGLVESRMCPIFSSYPMALMGQIGSESHKNPWRDLEMADNSGQFAGRVTLVPSEEGNILSDRAHFGMDKVTVQHGMSTGDLEIERPLRIGMLPRIPLGPLRFGGVEGKYIFFRDLELKFNFRYEKPTSAALYTNSLPNSLNAPMLPPMKVSIMIVRQRSGDVGEMYKQSIEKHVTSGNVNTGAAGPVDTRGTNISGPSDFIGDNLLMDPLGQPFGVGKKLWQWPVSPPPPAPPVPNIPTAITDISVNGNRNGSFYFQCPVQKKWFTVVGSRTFVLYPQQQPPVPVAEPQEVQQRGFTTASTGPTQKTVTFKIPIKSRMLMKSLLVHRIFPEGSQELLGGGITSNDIRTLERQTALHAGANTYVNQVPNPVEWMVPADVNMSDYHVISKAYSHTEHPLANEQRLSTKPYTSAAGITVGSNPPCPLISYNMVGKMSYNDL